MCKKTRQDMFPNESRQQDTKQQGENVDKNNDKITHLFLIHIKRFFHFLQGVSYHWLSLNGEKR